MKNPTSGDISVMLNSYRRKFQHEQQFLFRAKVKTMGNPLTHAMRGYVDKFGKSLPTIIMKICGACLKEYGKRELENPPSSMM